MHVFFEKTQRVVLDPEQKTAMTNSDEISSLVIKTADEVSDITQKPLLKNDVAEF